MNTIIHFLPLIKVLASFTCMLLAIRLRLGIGLSILVGSLTLALLFGMPLVDLVSASGRALTHEKALYLSLIIGLIMVLSKVMETTGQTEKLLAALSGRIPSRRLKIVFFPALIGLLPMPGGAIFSAPLAKSAAKGLDLEPRTLALLNYWFRHIWEMAWPLYPGLILASSLSGLPVGRLVLLLLPGVAATIAIGWIFLLRPGVLKLPKISPGNKPKPQAAEGNPLLLGLPFLLAIGGAVSLEGLVLSLWPGLPFELGLCAALAAAVIATIVQNKNGLAHAGRAFIGKGLWSMILVIAAIFIYQQVLTEAGAVAAMAAMSGTGALLASAILLPFVVGLVSGISVAYVGASFPLLFGILAQLGLGAQLEAYIVLGTFAGYAGVLISPIHICFMVTCQFFKTDIGATWRRLAPMCLLLLALGVLYFLALK